MGAEQSSAQDGPGIQTHPPGPSATTSKACYYEILGVGRQASDDEIKKAYRRKALELHPDRNYGDIEMATKQFAEVQSAYEILSDPQERAWYDAHRDDILRGNDHGEEYFGHDIRLTGSGDIIALMSRLTKRVPFTNASNGFYGSLRSMFGTIAKEEDASAEWEGLEAIKYPDFGAEDDSYEEVVRPFYAIWIGFTTRKTFSWLDSYKYTEAPDRRIRRLMEKENKRLRDEGIRDFNDAVRSLVAFVRKRDPRYVPTNLSEADRQKTLREAAAAQAARSRAANQSKLDEQILPGWMQSREAEPEFDSESELSEEEQFECVICGKTFKSEKQYETHEKSKKHIKAILQLKRQMDEENKLFELNSVVIDKDDDIPQYRSEDEYLIPQMNLKAHQITIASSGQNDHSDLPLDLSSVSKTERSETETGIIREDLGKSVDLEPNLDGSFATKEESDGDYASKEEVEARLSELTVVGDKYLDPDDKENEDASGPIAYTSNTSTVACDRNGDSEQKPKLGKAKAKRAKKAARHNTSAQGDIACATCNETFDSKSKLFRHIKELDHAQLQQPAEKSRGLKKR